MRTAVKKILSTVLACALMVAGVVHCSPAVVAAAATPAGRWFDAAAAELLAAASRQKGLAYVRIGDNQFDGVTAAGAKALSGLRLEYDIYSGNTVRTRLYIAKPELLQADAMLSAQTNSTTAERAQRLFQRHFSNTLQAVALSSLDAWGQHVRMAVHTDLTAADLSRLHAYAYDPAQNTYRRVAQPNFQADETGKYIYCTVSGGGVLIVSKGALTKRDTPLPPSSPLPTWDNSGRGSSDGSSGGGSSGGGHTSQPASVPVTGVAVSPDAMALVLGASGQLTVAVSPANATDKRVEWTSSDSAVATVDGDGVVTGIGDGSAMVTATTADGGYSAACAVTVGAAPPAEIPVTGVIVSPGTAALTVGETHRLTAAIQPANATNQAVSWASSDSSVATVDGSGLVTAVAPGSATITATTADGGYTASCAVTVSAAAIPVDDVTVTPSAANLTLGDKQQLTAGIVPANATDQGVTWSSSNDSVAAVDTDGLVTAVAPGSATVTVTTADGSYTASCAVTVSAAAISVEDVTVTPTSASLTVGETLPLTADISPANATNQGVTWQSDNTAVAAVNGDGLVTAVAPGSATITATTADGGRTDTCAVTVSAASIPVTGVTVNPTSASLTVGETLPLTADISPDNATNQGVTWSSDNPAVATVNSDGLVTAVAAGSATISVTTADGNYTANCAITVALPPQEPSIVKDWHGIIPHGSIPSFSPLATVTDGGSLSYQWYENTAPQAQGATPISGATGDFSPPDNGELRYYFYIATNTLAATGATAQTQSSIFAVDAGSGKVLYFDLNGGSGTAPDPILANDGATVMLPDGANITPPTGKTLLGWSAALNDYQSFYPAGQSRNITAGTTLYALWQGDGSSTTNPIFVHDKDSLQAIGQDAASLDKHYQLIADINAGNSWRPIGDANDSFTGSLVGNGYTVTIGGVVAETVQGATACGLFGVVGAGGAVSGLVVKGEIVVNGQYIRAGGVAGICNGSITNCRSDVDVRVTAGGGLSSAGGVVGLLADVVTNCLATGSVEITGAVVSHAGGVIGSGTTQARITGSVAVNPSVSASGTSSAGAGRIWPGTTIETAAGNFGSIDMTVKVNGTVQSNTSNHTGRGGGDCSPSPSWPWWGTASPNGPGWDTDNDWQPIHGGSLPTPK